MTPSKCVSPVSKFPLHQLLGCIATIVLAAPACVTVNVNFPEGAVQKQTDDYVKDLYRAREKKNVAPASVPASTVPTGSTQSPQSSRYSYPDFLKTWVFMSSDAVAEEVSFNINTSEALSIKESLRSRVSEMIKYKKQGMIGETKDGLVRTQDAANSKPVLKKLVDDLVSSENADRNRLYREVMKANQLPPSKEASLRSSFARSFQSESPSGTWVQDSSGAWSQKP